MQMFTRLVIGPLVAIGGAFPAAGLVALIYGFPIPFRGKEQGVEAVGFAMAAVLFYGVLGGFVVLAVLGLLAAGIADAVGRGNPARTILLTVVFALSASLLCAVSLAVLDLFIGPW